MVEEKGRFKRVNMEDLNVLDGGKGKVCCILWWADKQKRSGGEELS
jgi:hypothetical protein